MCRHGCFQIQINDKIRKFVNELCKQLHKLTGVEQRVTFAYHPQANGLEHQNRIIKNCLVKVLYYSVLMFLDKDESNEREHRGGDGNEEQPFDLDFFGAIFSSTKKVRTTIADEAAENIKATQKKQKRDYDRRHFERLELFCSISHFKCWEKMSY